MIFQAASVVFLRLDHLARKFIPLTFLVGGIKANKSTMDPHAYTIAIGGKCVRSVQIPFEYFRVISLNVLGGNNNFDLHKGIDTV